MASVELRGKPRGAAICFNADVSAIAKADLKAGSILDGEGDFTIYGEVRSSVITLTRNYLPLGLANHVKLVHLEKPISLSVLMMSKLKQIHLPTQCERKPLPFLL